MIDTFLAQTGIAALQLASRQAIMAVTWISKMFVESSTMLLLNIFSWTFNDMKSNKIRKLLA